MHKIIHFAFAKYGGAGNIASRLNDALSMLNIDSILVYRSYEKSIANYFKLSIIYLLSFLDNYAIKKKGSDTFFSVLRAKVGIKLSTLPFEANSIFHLHWIPGLLSMKELNSFKSLNSKLVITLHDMWFFTGGCHYSYGCQQYKSGCTDCPLVHKYFRPLIARNFIVKESFFKKNEFIKITSPSKYLQEKASQSQIFKNQKVELIKYPIDFTIKYGSPKGQAKLDIGIRSEAFTIGFIAADIRDPRKNFDYAYKSVINLKNIQPFKEIKFLVIGDGPIKKFKSDDFIIRIPAIKEPRSLSRYYAACDVILITSRDDNYPLVGMEAIINNVFLLVSDSGGTKELIERPDLGMTYQTFDDLCTKLSQISVNQPYNNIKNEYDFRLLNDEIIENYIRIYRKFDKS